MTNSPERRRELLPGVRLCVQCQSAADRQQQVHRQALVDGVRKPQVAADGDGEQTEREAERQAGADVFPVRDPSFITTEIRIDDATAGAYAETGTWFDGQAGGGYAGTYRATRDAYLKAANELKLATGPYKAARDAYVAATATFTKSLYE